MAHHEYSALCAFLLSLPDPRPGHPRYPWPALIRLLLMGLASGCTGTTKLVRWASLRRERLAGLLALPDSRMPSERTFGRLLDALPPVLVEDQLTAYQQTPAARQAQVRWRGRDGVERWLWSLDGKVVRTASAYGHQVWLVSLTCAGTGRVIRQARVAAGTNEIPTAAALLVGLDLTGVVLACDAGLAHRDLAAQILAQGGDYLMVIKGNEPEAQAGIAELFATPSSPGCDPDRERTLERERAHGRLAERLLEASELVEGTLEWPGVHQVCRRANRVTLLRQQRRRQVRPTYLVTSLPATVAGPRQLLWLARGRWGIENRLHWRRDVTLGEDRCRVRARERPHLLAALRNALLAAVHSSGDWPSLPDALAYFEADPIHAMQFIAGR